MILANAEILDLTRKNNPKVSGIGVELPDTALSQSELSVLRLVLCLVHQNLIH